MMVLKKLISILLVIVIVFSVFMISITSGFAYERENEYKPTIYIRDAQDRSYSVWAWLLDDTKLFDRDENNKPQSSEVKADKYGFKAFSCDYSISQETMYFISVIDNVTKTPLFSNIYSYLNTYVDIDSNGKAQIYYYNPDLLVDKSNAFPTGIWVDTNPTKDDISSLVRITQDSNNQYSLYLPSGVNCTMPVYHTFTNLKIDSQDINNGDVFTFTNDSTYELSGDLNGTLSICQMSGTKTMMFSTNREIPHSKARNFDNASSKSNYILNAKSKLNISGGTYSFLDENANKIESGDIETIKGRGNSTWDFAYSYYGKYPFNLKLEKKTDKILGGDFKAKKYVFTAMNTDQASMRDTMVDAIAKDLHYEYTSEVETCNVYDNGVFLGVYCILTHPDIGKNHLLYDVESLSDKNEELNPDIESLSKKTCGTSAQRGYYSYVDSQSPEDITGGYLLEIELSTRISNSISAFVSDQGQSVSISSPEYATKEEVEYIKNLFNQMESVVYKEDVTLEEISEYIDVESFAKMFLMQEFTKDIDACATSFYIYKDSDKKGDGKFHAAPIWDNDWSCGQTFASRDILANAPKASNGIRYSSYWNVRYRFIPYISSQNVLNIQAQLCQCDDFWNEVFAFWKTSFYKVKDKYVYSPDVENLDSSDTYISSIYNKHKLSFEANEKRWNFIKTNPTYSYGTFNTGKNPRETIMYLNNWLYERFEWINDNIGPADVYCGDANGDKCIDIVDVTTIQQYLAGMISSDNIMVSIRGRIFDDNKLVINDATAVQQYLAKSVINEKIGKHKHPDQTYKN